MKALLTQVVVADAEIEDYVPEYANPAIHFATDDMGSDEAMGGVLLDILIVIIAFIFAITISNTIARESATIGTLRASGYTRGGTGGTLSVDAGHCDARRGADWKHSRIYGVQKHCGFDVL